MSFSAEVDLPNARSAEASRRLVVGFLNWAHALDHFVILIYPTVVIELAAIYGRSYATLIALSTACFVAFGLFSLPAGWLRDHWSRRPMIAGFFFGLAASPFSGTVAPHMIALAVALFVLGIFAAIYHPIGVTVLLANARDRGRTLATNGVFGNLGVALAAGATALVVSWFGWRAAFSVPE